MWRSLFQRFGEGRRAATAPIRWMGCVALMALTALAGCGGGGPAASTDEPPAASALVDASGGALVGPDGVRLDVPAGALTGPVTLTMTREATGAPALLDGQSAAVYAITPHGLPFQKPAVLTFPAAVLPGQSALQINVLRAQPGGAWQVLDPPIDSPDGSASVLLDGLSYYSTTGIARSASGPRTGVIQNIVGWATPEPGVPASNNDYTSRRIVERTTVGVVVSTNVDPWCGSSATITSTWLRSAANAPNGYALVQQQKQTVAVAGMLASATFEYDVPVGAAKAAFSFAGWGVCDSPAPLPPNAPQYVVPPHPLSVQLEAVAVPAPTITQQPADMLAAPGDTVSFVVAATAPDALTINWQRSDNGGTQWADAGATVGTFSFILLPAQAQALWRAKVCNVSASGSNCRESTTVKVSAPVPDAPWQADSPMAGSGTHSMAIDIANTYVLSWGTNNGGALGRNSADPAPARVAGPPMRSVAAGAWYSVGLGVTGDVYAWGWGANVGAAIGSTTLDNPLPRAVRDLAHVAGIATRYNHTLAVTDSGEIWGFGPEESLALGPVLGHRGVRQIPGLARMRQVAAGERHSLALAADGTVWSWGENGSGQLGTGAAGAGVARSAPQAVPGLSEVVQIAAGAHTSFALKRDGSVWSWGDAALVGRSGDATAPAPVPGLAGVQQIAAGHRTAWALLAQGVAFGWGDNRFGQVGVGSASALISAPARMPAGLQFVAMAGGEFHGLAMSLTVQGRRVCGFGNNGNLQLDGVAGPDANAPGGRCVDLP